MRWALIAVLLLPWVAESQTCTLPSASTRLESDRFTVGFRTTPDPVQVGKHFVLELTVCPKQAGAAPESIQVDAQMPEHRHGMNYAAQVIAAAGGVYRAEGLMFHMPGRWDLMVDVRSGGKTDRLVRTVPIE